MSQNLKISSMPDYPLFEFVAKQRSVGYKRLKSPSRYDLILGIKHDASASIIETQHEHSPSPAPSNHINRTLQIMQETVSSENSFKQEEPNGKIWIELSHQESMSHKVNVTEEDERERA